MRLRDPARFVGREDELAVLVEAVASARSGTPAVVIVEGEAGLGKTRLVSEAIERTTSDQDTVIPCHGVSLTGEQLAFGGLVQVVRSMARNYPASHRNGMPAGARRLLDSWDEDGSGLTARIGRAEMFDGLLGFVEHSARQPRPLARRRRPAVVGSVQPGPAPVRRSDDDGRAPGDDVHGPNHGVPCVLVRGRRRLQAGPARPDHRAATAQQQGDGRPGHCTSRTATERSAARSGESARGRCALPDRGVDRRWPR